MTRKKQRMYVVIISLVLLAAAAGLILSNLEDNIVFFRTPTQLVTNPPQKDELLRVGGIVREGTLKDLGSGDYEFEIADTENSLKVFYSGLLPTLFREGQGVVALGRMSEADEYFKAEQILAKHDENYMPPEVYRSMREQEELKAKDKPASAGAE